MELAKRDWDARMSNRVSRSKARSGNIMERARSFERAAAERANNGTSLPSSRRGSISRRRRSPSAGNARTDQYWQQVVDSEGSRPPSRQDYEARRGVGRVNVQSWEDRIRSEASTEKYKLRTPPSQQKSGGVEEMQKFAYEIAEKVVDDLERDLQTSSVSDENDETQSCIPTPV